MSQFDFLEQDFPELYQLCNDAEKYQNTDSGIALLKARQALEYIVRKTTDYEIEDLFTGICELNDEGIIDSNQCSQFHCVRRIANEGIHEKNVSQDDIETCMDALFDIVNWYVTYKKSCSKKFVPQEVSEDGENSDNLSSSTYKKEINPLETSGNIDFNNTGETENELKKDVFETDEEYVTRIAARAPIQLGYGILDPKNVDEYTKIIFLTFHINKIEGTCFVPINAF